jgi:hypothetical protein
MDLEFITGWLPESLVDYRLPIGVALVIAANALVFGGFGLLMTVAPFWLERRRDRRELARRDQKLKDARAAADNEPTEANLRHLEWAIGERDSVADALGLEPTLVIRKPRKTRK